MAPCSTTSQDGGSEGTAKRHPLALLVDILQGGRQAGEGSCDPLCNPHTSLPHGCTARWRLTHPAAQDGMGGSEGWPGMFAVGGLLALCREASKGRMSTCRLRRQRPSCRSMQQHTLQGKKESGAAALKTTSHNHVSEECLLRGKPQFHWQMQHTQHHRARLASIGGCKPRLSAGLCDFLHKVRSCSMASMYPPPCRPSWGRHLCWSGPAPPQWLAAGQSQRGPPQV